MSQIAITMASDASQTHEVVVSGWGSKGQVCREEGGVELRISDRLTPLLSLYMYHSVINTVPIYHSVLDVCPEGVLLISSIDCQLPCLTDSAENVYNPHTTTMPVWRGHRRGTRTSYQRPEIEDPEIKSAVCSRFAVWWS